MILYSSINDSIAQIHQTNKNESMTNGMKQEAFCEVLDLHKAVCLLRLNNFNPCFVEQNQIFYSYTGCWDCPLMVHKHTGSTGKYCRLEVPNYKNK